MNKNSIWKSRVCYVKLIFINAILLFTSCMQTDNPKISEMRWQMNWLYNTTTQKLSNFFTFDIDITQLSPKFLGSNLILHMDKKDLLWKLRRTDHSLETNPSDITILKYSGNYALLNQELLPIGEYKIQLENHTTFHLDQKKFSVNYQIPDITAFPSVDKGFVVPKDKQPIIIFIYRHNQFFILTHTLPYQPIPKKNIRNFYYLYTYDPVLKAGLINGPH